MKRTTPRALPGARSSAQLIFTVFGGIGIAGIFLDFAWNTSPFDTALDKELWQIAWPFFLPLIILPASIRWIFSSALSKTERLLGYILSASIVCMTLSAYVTAMDLPHDFPAWIAFAAPFLTFGVGIYVLLRTRHNSALQSFRPIMSLQFVFLANCLLCLISFFTDWQAGAYCSLVTAIMYVTQMISVCRSGKIK